MTTPSEVVAEYVDWLAAFLPADYYENYRRYRWDIPLRRDHQRAAFEAGWIQPTWPREHGGRSLGLRDAMEIRIEGALRSAPKLPNVQGPGVAAPGIRQFGTPAQIERLLVPLLRGDEWWALGMSEPEAGSDFAGLRTRAEQDTDVFRVNGHKIWTTQAHESRWCTLYARTDPNAPKHRGISCLILDLHSPGVRIEPIRMSSISDETFCEVFLDDVEIPLENLLGPLNGGWNVALSSLHHERQMIWIMNWVEIKRGLNAVRGARHGGAGEERQDLCAELGSLLADAEALRATGYRALGNELAGRNSPEADIMKLLGSVTLQRVWELAAAGEGPSSASDPDLLFERQDALAATIYGGTSEVQRNIIAERLLGLPKG
ncbi:MAG: acyl-CoA dehydrogenase family protein [Actinomycetota bacterium]|uniref:Acyl-CoA dehydrogenase family protein n=1 Tax=Mycobacterium lentiflavum TaxID=141349 RepID=A0ABY3UN89_MYCLN|nr:acyl-CoA dehydrogenase family protein [Mycobacterium lentiflavum]MEE3065639.1 acyl-CoA dehydrogenase family protein [Actinomycetota bacterium]ULP41076.1 acyl-CoA dehydrogenase family protein [Mycobacterium lentiflavum]